MQHIGDPHAAIDGRLIYSSAVPAVLTDAAVIAVDARIADEFLVTLGGNRQMGNPVDGYDGQILTFYIRQDGVGGRTLTFGSAYRHVWSNTGNVAGAECAVSFRKVGTQWLQLGQGPYV